MQQVLQQHSPPPQAPARRSQPTSYEGIVDLIDEAVFRTDDAGRWTFLSHAWMTVTGFPIAASIGRCLADVVHSSDARLYAGTIGSLLNGSAASAHEHIRVVTAHGAVRWLVLRVRSERETNGKVLGLCGTLYDITERKAEGVRREEQLRASQKMEAIGRLAGGISHDFNNLLTVILSYAQLIEEAVGTNGTVSADVTELRRASERAGELTRQLLAYSRQQLLKPTTLDLDRAVGEMATMLRRVIGEDIALTLVPGPRAATVRADAGQIEQVIVNLAVNARDAMTGGGTLTIATTSAELDDSVGDLWGVRVVPGPYVVLSVTDTGQGMDKETQRRIFEPFFTTKDLGAAPVSDSPRSTASSSRAAVTSGPKARPIGGRRSGSICPRSVRARWIRSPRRGASRSPAARRRFSSWRMSTRCARSPAACWNAPATRCWTPAPPPRGSRS